MDTSKLTQDQHKLRMNIRNFLLVATLPELQKELLISLEINQPFRAECIQELIDERVN